MDLPEDWEMLQFSKNPDRGRCAFADRYQFRMEFNWRKVGSAPDFPQMLKDYANRLKQEFKQPRIRQTSHGVWSGVDCDSETMLSSRFGRYFEAESCLVEIVFIWRLKREPALMRHILSSLDVEKASSSGLQRWKAFGMDILAPRSLVLNTCTVEPAKAALSFTDSHQLQRQNYERLGMVAHWLKVPVSQWLKGRTPKGITVRSQTNLSSGHHSIEQISGVGRFRMAVPAFGKRFHYEEVAWICPRDGRLYSVSDYSFQPLTAQTLQTRLNCCAAKESIR